MQLDARIIHQLVHNLRDFAETLFNELSEGSADGGGVTRDTYGKGENFAHEWFARQAKTLNMDIAVDSAANTYATWAGADRQSPRVIIGSHLDSVKCGGNFDGAAGVIAGLVCVAALQAAGLRPRFDLTTMGVRAEESAWFQISYIGSRAALGRLPPAALEARRIDTQRSLAEHMADCGADIHAVTAAERAIVPSSVKAFLEVHIEQAPSLLQRNLPIAVCTAIPGNFRYRNVTVRGELGHVGTPRQYRRDAMMAAVQFADRLDRIWENHEKAGRPMACTFGRFHTDADTQSLTNIPGLFHFSLDVRAFDEDHLRELEAQILEAIAAIERERGVVFELGERASAPVGVADPKIRVGFEEAARELQVPAMLLGSPGSHDSAAFAEAGVPFGMIFVRNANGSHNPNESMEIDDFLEAVSVLALWLVRNGIVMPADGD